MTQQLGLEKDVHLLQVGQSVRVQQTNLHCVVGIVLSHVFYHVQVLVQNLLWCGHQKNIKLPTLRTTSYSQNLLSARRRQPDHQ